MKTNKIFEIIITVALAFSLTGCGQDKYTTKMIEANKYLAAGNYEQAIEAFKAAIDIDSKKTDAYFQLAKAYIADENYSQAVAAYDDILSIDATNTDAIIGKVNAQVDNNDLNRALKTLNDSATQTNDQKITDKLNEMKTGMHGFDTVYTLNLNGTGLIAAIQQVFESYGCPVGYFDVMGSTAGFGHMKIKSPIHPADIGDDWCGATSGNYTMTYLPGYGEGVQGGFDVYENSENSSTTSYSANEIHYVANDIHDGAEIGFMIEQTNSGFGIVINNDGYDIEFELELDGTLTGLYYFADAVSTSGMTYNGERFRVYNFDGSYVDEKAKQAAEDAKKNLPTYISRINAELNAYGISLGDYLNTSELTRMING